MRFEAFTAKLKRGVQAAKSFLGIGPHKVYDGVKPPPKDQTADNDMGGSKKMSASDVFSQPGKGPAYTPPSPSSATLEQRRQGRARRIQRLHNG